MRTKPATLGLRPHTGPEFDPAAGHGQFQAGVPALPVEQLDLHAGPERLQVVNPPGLGIRNWFPMERFQVSDRLDVLVNLANGNVVVVARDLTIRVRG